MRAERASPGLFEHEALPAPCRMDLNAELFLAAVRGAASFFERDMIQRLVVQTGFSSIVERIYAGAAVFPVGNSLFA